MNSEGFQPPPQPPKTETIVKTYENAKEFEKDQKKMMKQGWNAVNIQDQQKNRTLAGKVLLPFARPDAQFVATYQRVVEPKAQKPSILSSLTAAASESPTLSPFKKRYQEELQKRLDRMKKE